MKKNSNRSHRTDAYNLAVFSDISERSAKKKKNIKDAKKQMEGKE